MLTGRDILAFTYADWHASWSTPQQLMSRLAPANRVLYIDQPRSFLFGLKPVDPQGAGVWEGPALQEVRPNLHVYHMPHCFLPVGRLPLPLAKATLSLNGGVMARLVRRQLEKLGMRDVVLWNFSPLHGKAVPQVPASLRIYDICDEWVNYIDYAAGRAVVRWVEEELTRAADLVFVGTENGKALRHGMNAEMHVVPHGADYAHFSRAAEAETEVPADIARLPRPVIGSVGVLDPARFDTDTVVYLAQARPEWSVVLVGPARPDMDLCRLQECPNVYLLGNRSLAELPGYLKGMDAALIPYMVNEATRHIYPLKLQEYLAAGKPVISSALPAVEPFDGVVRVARDRDAWLRAIDAAVVEQGRDRVEARQRVARVNSWEHRVEEKTAHIVRLTAGANQGSE